MNPTLPHWESLTLSHWHYSTEDCSSTAGIPAQLEASHEVSQGNAIHIPMPSPTPCVSHFHTHPFVFTKACLWCLQYGSVCQRRDSISMSFWMIGEFKWPGGREGHEEQIVDGRHKPLPTSDSSRFRRHWNKWTQVLSWRDTCLQIALLLRRGRGL